MNEATKAAKVRAQKQVGRITNAIKERGVSLSANAMFQRTTIHDNELLAIISLLGEVVPGGEAAVWDRVARIAGENADKIDAKRIDVTSQMPGRKPS